MYQTKNISLLTHGKICILELKKCGSWFSADVILLKLNLVCSDGNCPYHGEQFVMYLIAESL